MQRLFSVLDSELFRFLVVGGTAALLDLGLYLLLKAIGLPIPVAKGASFVIVGIANYVANRYFTFGRGASGAAPVLLYAALYACTLGLNVLANEAMLAVLRIGGTVELLVAWAVATALSATVNFLGMKHFVFRGERPPRRPT